MTPAQKVCFDAVAGLIGQGVAPSYDDIARAVGCSKSTAHRLVQVLIGQGRLRRTGTGWRSLVVVGALDEALAQLVAAYGVDAVRAGLEAMR